jgi:hypothetical protein
MCHENLMRIWNPVTGRSNTVNSDTYLLRVAHFNFKVKNYYEWLIQSVHCVGFLDGQNILWADSVVSPGKLKVIHTVIT